MQIRLLIGLITCVMVVSPSLVAYSQVRAAEQTTPSEPAPSMQPAPVRNQTPTNQDFEGRGVVQGSAFNRGRNANVSLRVNRDTFVLNLVEPPGTRARAQYRGSIVRRNNVPTNSNSFAIDGRVQTFESSASTRILNNTTGTCRIEVFDARVISTTCRAATPDSNTQFLGLERF